MKPRNVVKQAALAVVPALVLSFAVPAQGQTVLIDFGTDSTFRGISVVNPDLNGKTWNNIGPGAFYTDLHDMNNNATTLDFGFSSNVGTDSYNGPAGDTSAGAAASVGNTDIDAAALGNLGVINAAFDFVTGENGSNPLTFEIQGLDPAKQYNLTFYGSHKFSGESTTVYGVYTDGTYASLVNSVNLEIMDTVSPWLHNRDTVATLSNLSPQTGNILFVQVGSLSGFNQGYLNSMEISVVPEPTSLALLGLGGAALTLIRRRRA